MNAKHLSALLALPALSGALACAQEAAQAPAASSAEAAAESPLQPDPQLHCGALENGLRYIIRPTKEPAGQASMRLYVETGALDELPETSGISHFIEHMVFNGSRHFRRGELIPTMQNLGLGFGGDANAYTGMEHTIYKLDLPNLRPETVEFALTILRDFADGATLADEDIEHERGIIISELKARDSEASRADIEMMHKLVGGTRVPEFQPIGSEEVIRNCPAETIRQYYREHYVPSRMVLIITGDVSPETAGQWVKQHFASMESRPTPQRPAVGTPEDMGAGCFIVPDASAANCRLMLAVVNPWKQRPDTLEQRVEDLPLELACAMLNRRLGRLARRADSPFLSASAIPREDACGAAEIFSLSLSTRPEQWQAGLAAAEAELRRAALHGFSATELNEVIAAIGARTRKSMETWERASAQTIAEGVLASVTSKSIFTAPAEEARVYAVGIRRVLANPVLCREALAAAWEADRVRLMMGGRIAEGATPEGLAGAYASARQQDVAPLEEKQLTPFAYDHIGEPGRVVAQQYHEDLGITTLTLSNGVRVNLKPMGAGMGRIYMSAAVDGGMMRLPRIPALAEVAQAIMSKGGLEAHSAEDISRMFAGHNVGCTFAMDDERFVFNANTTPRDLELQCKLLCASIMHPGFRPEGELLLRRSLPAFFRSIETTPEGAFSEQAPKSFMAENARFLVPTAEQFAAVDAAAVKAALSPFLEKGALELTLVGDFKVDDVLPLLERSFGAMPQREAEFSPLPEGARQLEFQPWGKSEFLRYDTALDKTLVAHVRPAGNGRDLRRNRRLAILRNIVGGRLFGSIRAELGESYSPTVQLDLRQGYENAATFTAMSHGVKGNREMVVAAMEHAFASVGRGEIMEEEFSQAMRPYLADAEQAWRRPAFWMGNMIRLQSDPQALELLRCFRADAASITLEEIRQLAMEIFGSGNAGGNWYFTVPQDDEASASPAAPVAEQPAAAATGDTYAIACTMEAWQDPAWKAVVEALVAKHSKAGRAVRCVVLNGSPGTKDIAFIADFLRTVGARHAAFVMKPGEIGRETVNCLHRATRQVDADPWGDCLWGIITGASAQDALRVATAEKPLVIKRLLSTTNVGAAPFEYSYCITDWTNAPVLTQSGYREPETREFSQGEGREHLFAEQLSTQRPQFIVTSSHATPFNLEMPFGKGLIFPAGGRFRLLTQEQMPQFSAPLGAAMQGHPQYLGRLAEKLQCPAIEPDGETRVWLAAGNCLFGNAQHCDGSMVVTALSAYTCNQVVGYTVPSWYGKGGWGTLSLFMENTEGTSLAEAWFLNNQFILHETQQLSPELLKVEFNDEEIGTAFFRQMAPTLQQLSLSREKVQEAIGLVHDRDVVAFYGDPAWHASVDGSHSPRPWRVEWVGEKRFTITANADRKGRAAVWFPTAATGRGATGCNVPGAVLTDDFILFPELEMKKGETLTVTIQ